MSYKRITNIAGWLVFAIAFIVYFMSAERTGSLWDCGEFILGAHKLQVVHPPGAAIFLIVGRIFAWIAELFSNNPEDIAFAVNLMSGICTAFAAMFVCWTTILLGKISIVGRNNEAEESQVILLGFAGLVAGLTTAFCSSIWFSAVEGEVYAMSTFFTAMTFWSGTKWYCLPNNKEADRWLVLTIYLGGLSSGVHLLSILTFPALALLYYFKKYKEHTLKGALISMAAGVGLVIFTMKVVIAGIPVLWSVFEKICVNGFGLPFHSGIIPTFLLIAALIYYLLKLAEKKGYYNLQWLTISAMMIIVAFSTMGVIVLRANADTPVNMNTPTDAFRLIPYLNREQYGERALIYGPHYDAKAIDIETDARYGRVGDKYDIVDEKFDYMYNSRDKILFPRIGHTDPGRPALHKMWKGTSGPPGQGYNIRFLFQYQMGWMYWRYFMWNFVGRQNSEQGYYPWKKDAGHWLSGVKFIDEMRLYNMDELPEVEENHKAHNKYYFIPLILGLIGFFFHLKNSRKEFLALLTLFIITGLGIIIYSNQPPNEPRERDYVLVGSFFTFAMWIGMSVLSLGKLLAARVNLKPKLIAGLAGIVALSAPIIMGFENFDDHTRNGHYASRDYASNFLESCEPNAIIFTYGDNDTYPLWYVQEVEGIRTDVRVVNLSLIAVDWYIEKLRSKVNDSPAIKLTIPTESYRGNKRNQVFFFNPNNTPGQAIELTNLLQFIGERHPLNSSTGTIESFAPTRKAYITTNRQKALEQGMITSADSTNVVPRIEISFPESKLYLTKDEVAILDVIASNLWDRPIYFSVTCKNDKLMNLNPYTQMEGMGLRIIPVRSEIDRTFPTIYGSGRLHHDRIYRNVMERWTWGEFDKLDVHVNPSYGAEVQAMRVIMMRTAIDMMEKGDRQRAGELAKKYFDAFPHFNFPYQPNIMPVISVLLSSGQLEEAKKHIRILAIEAADYMVFYDSLDEEVLKGTFDSDLRIWLSSINQIIRAAKDTGDSTFEEEINQIVGNYSVNRAGN